MKEVKMKVLTVLIACFLVHFTWAQEPTAEAAEPTAEATEPTAGTAEPTAEAVELTQEEKDYNYCIADRVLKMFNSTRQCINQKALEAHIAGKEFTLNALKENGAGCFKVTAEEFHSTEESCRQESSGSTE